METDSSILATQLNLSQDEMNQLTITWYAR
jgi:hypothetical protein